MSYTIKNFPAKVGLMSLIGTYGKPASWGNYFELSNGPRVVNMWAENLGFLVEDGVLTDIKCAVFEENAKTWAVVIDERVPEDYYYKGLCFTGYFGPSKDIVLEMISVMPYKDDSRLLEHTDYKEYCRIRNITAREYTDANGEKYSIERVQVNSGARQLKGEWTVELVEDIVVINPNVINMIFKELNDGLTNR